MDRPPLSLGRKLFYSALLSSALLGAGFLLVEGGLRLAGYGASPSFCRQATSPEGRPLWRENRDCTVPFFGRDLARRPQPFRVPVTKAPGTYRIFILGSSAAMGDPEPSFSLARCLEALLGEAYPGIHFEVVNAGITAINSNLLRGFAADCARMQPDLFIIYEGNNEVIGPFGPSGVFAPFLRSDRALRLAVWLKGLRTGQLLSQTLRSLQGNKPAREEWGGMQMFLRQQIAEDDPRLESVRRRFQDNLLAIIKAGRDAGARSLLCTVVTNQRDFAPFMSRHREDLSAAELATWDSVCTAAGLAEKAGDHAAAEAGYRKALAIDGRYAELNYRLGRLLLASGRNVEAAELLSRAQDLDTLRFRTDSRLNQAIRELAAKAGPDCALIDLDKALSAKSARGIPGDELLYEHVHLTLKGTYLAACELFPLIEADLKARSLAQNSPAPQGYDELRQALAFSVYEQAMIQVNLLNRFHGAPFTGQADNALRISLAERRCAQANTLLQSPGATEALSALYAQALAKAPDDWILARNAGAMLLARKNPAEALPLLKKAEAWIPDDIDTLVALGNTEQALGHAKEAEAAFARARLLEPNYPGIPTAPTQGLPRGN